MITKTIKTGLILIAIASFSFASAQERTEVKNEDALKAFKKFDSNFDEAITLDEYKSIRMKDASKEEQIEKRFLKMDIDNNGSINLEEFTYVYESRKKTMKKKKTKKTEADIIKD
jgi:Ca2+-binding EF-hand superfamily protein